MHKLHTLVLLLSCDALEMKARREACRETYLKYEHIPEDMKAIFLVGRPGQQTALCGDILYLDCPDTYLGLPQKIWAGIKEAFTLWDFDWIFKADDDTYVNMLRVKNYYKERDYVGRRVMGGFDPEWHHNKDKVGGRNGGPSDPVQHTPVVTPWAGGGVGYFLSKHAASLVAREPLSHVLKESYEDKFVGDVMGSHGIYLHGLHQGLRDAGQQGNIFGATTIHPLKPKQMREVYWRLHRAGEIGT